MTFEECANLITWRNVSERAKARAIWQYQQFYIDRLLEDRAKDRARINELEDELERLKQSSNGQANENL